MPRRRISRLFFEVVFLVAVAAVVTAAHMRPFAVIVIMLLAWVVVALFEWTAWLDQPHYGSGLPPRYYVPQLALPPPRPVEQHGYPRPHRVEDEQTWIVSPEDWAAALDEWPVLDSSPVGEETEIAVADGREEPVSEFPPAVDELGVDELGVEEPAAAASESPPASAVQPSDDETRVVAGVSATPSPSMPANEIEATAPPAAGESEMPVELPAVAARGTARHHLDPLEPARRDRLRWSRARADVGVIDLPNRPPEDRALPGAAARPDRPVSPGRPMIQ